MRLFLSPAIRRSSDLLGLEIAFVLAVPWRAATPHEPAPA
jgi:hypothetical protein